MESWIRTLRTEGERSGLAHVDPPDLGFGIWIWNLRVKVGMDLESARQGRLEPGLDRRDADLRAGARENNIPCAGCGARIRSLPARAFGTVRFKRGVGIRAPRALEIASRGRESGSGCAVRAPRALETRSRFCGLAPGFGIRA
jgi:hypothetical protein